MIIGAASTQTSRHAPPNRQQPRSNEMTHTGQTATRSRIVEHSDIERFTEISGDTNPLHYDEALASRSRFGRIIVQGGVTTDRKSVV